MLRLLCSTALFMVFVSCLAVSPVLAGTQDNAVVALHDKAPAKKATNTCAIIPPATAPEDPNTLGLACSDYSVDNAPVFENRSVYVVVARADNTAGIAGVSCGVAVTGAVGVFGWTLCADLDFPNGGWPGSGGGDRITWASVVNCQDTVLGTDGVHAVAGAFYVYAYGSGTIAITPNNAIPEFKVADCSAAESEVSSGGGVVGFGSELGFNPCALPPVPVEQTTWGSIKSLRSE